MKTPERFPEERYKIDNLKAYHGDLVGPLAVVPPRVGRVVPHVQPGRKPHNTVGELSPHVETINKRLRYFYRADEVGNVYVKRKRALRAVRIKFKK